MPIPCNTCLLTRTHMNDFQESNHMTFDAITSFISVSGILSIQFFFIRIDLLGRRCSFGLYVEHCQHWVRFAMRNLEHVSHVRVVIMPIY